MSPLKTKPRRPKLLKIPTASLFAYAAASMAVRVVPAEMGGHPAVALYSGNHLRLVLAEEDAIAVADQIIDTLEFLKGQANANNK